MRRVNARRQTRRHRALPVVESLSRTTTGHLTEECPVREKSGWRAMAEGPMMRKWRWQAPRAQGQEELAGRQAGRQGEEEEAGGEPGPGPVTPGVG